MAITNLIQYFNLASDTTPVVCINFRHKRRVQRLISIVKKMVLDKRRITITEVADDGGISFGSCQAIFTDVLSIFAKL